MQISIARANSDSSSQSIHPETPRIAESCTIFTVNINDTVYFGNNEDFRLRGTYMWLYPSQYIYTPSGYKTTYGAIAFGFNHNEDAVDGYVQGGMNDQGLALDGNGLPDQIMNAYPNREPL